MKVKSLQPSDTGPWVHLVTDQECDFTLTFKCWSLWLDVLRLRQTTTFFSISFFFFFAYPSSFPSPNSKIKLDDPTCRDSIYNNLVLGTIRMTIFLLILSYYIWHHTKAKVYKWQIKTPSFRSRNRKEQIEDTNSSLLDSKTLLQGKCGWYTGHWSFWTVPLASSQWVQLGLNHL